MSDKIVELVNTWHQFEKKNPKASIEDFCQHFLDQQKPAKKEKPVKQEKQQMYNGVPINKVIGKAFGRVSRMGFFYGKRVLSDQELNLDEFMYLEGVRNTGTPTKKELIELHVNEYSSGVEIIKRLVKMKLLDEFPDEQDRRSSRVKLTKKGIKTLDDCYPNMQQLGSIMYDPLSPEEKEQFAYLITKLDNIHYTAYISSKTKQLVDLSELIKNNCK